MIYLLIKFLELHFVLCRKQLRKINTVIILRINLYVFKKKTYILVIVTSRQYVGNPIECIHTKVR